MLFARLRLPTSEVCSTDSIGRDLAAKSVRGGLATVTSQASLFAVQLTATIVLARLLSPTAYGLFGMVAVVIAFAAMFKTFGLSAATIQRSTITREQISSLFWVDLSR